MKRHATELRPILNGFTLVEMLISMSLFSVLMGTLLGMLYTSSRGWSRANAGLIRTIQVTGVLDEFVWELEHLYHEPDSKDPVLKLGLDEQGDPVLIYLTCDPLWGEGVAGGVCEATWRVEADESVKKLKKSRRFLVGGMLTGEPADRQMLEGIQSVSVTCLKDGQWTDHWDQPERPQAVRIKVRTAGNPRIERWATALPIATRGEKQ